MQGSFTRSKVAILSGNVPVSYQDVSVAGSGIVVSGNLYQGPSAGETTNITQQIQQDSTLGVISGGVMTVLGNTIQVSSGTGYVMTGVFPNDFLTYVVWNMQTTPALPANDQVYLFIDNAGILQTNSGEPNTTQNILIGVVTTVAGGVPLYVQTIPKKAVHLASSIDKMLDSALGPVFNSGCVVQNVGLQLSVTQGDYYFGNLQFSPSGATAPPGATFTTFQQTGSLFGWTPTTGVNLVPTEWDDGSGILQPTTQFIKHSFFVVGDGSYEQYFLVFAQQQFASLAAAQTGALSLPPSFFSDNVVSIAAIILDSTGTIVFIQDIRPTLAFRSGAISSTSNHSALSNLAADDHKQYLLVSGTRSMAGALDMGGNNIVNATLVDGVNVPAHASRHNPGGADALTIGVPVTISTSNSQGVAGSYALSDHIHAHGNQPGGSLHALATGASAGFMSTAQFTQLGGATNLATPSTLMQRDANRDTQLRDLILVDPTTFNPSLTQAVASGATPYTLTWAPNPGSAGQALLTDGTGTTSWGNTVSSVATGTGLTGGPITTTGTVSLADTAVAPGAYTLSNITVDQQGRLTSAANGIAVTNVATGTGLTGGPITTTGTIALSVPVTIANGGTNSTTALTNNRVMVSNSGAIREAAALTNGQLLIGSTGAAPVGAALTAGTGISVTNGAGSVTIVNTGVTSVATGTGLTGGPITSTGTVSLENTAVTAGSYTLANLTVDAQGRLSAASSYSPSTVLTLIDDFLQVDANGGNNVGVGGDTRWQQTSSGSGASTIPSTVTSNEVGVVSITSGNANNNFCQWSKQSQTFTVGKGALSLEFRVKMTTAPSSGADSFVCGLLSTTTGATFVPGTSPCIAIRAQPVGTNANWQLITSTAASSTTNQTGTPVAWAANTWTKLRLDINAAGTSVTLSVNGTAATTNTSTIPTTTLFPAFFCWRNSGTVVTSLDYVFIQQTFTTPR